MTPKIVDMKVVRNREWRGEWVARAYILVEDGLTRYPPGDYYTADKADAIQTAKFVLEKGTPR